MKTFLRLLLVVGLAVPVFAGVVAFILWSAVSFGWLSASSTLEDWTNKLN